MTGGGGEGQAEGKCNFIWAVYVNFMHNLRGFPVRRRRPKSNVPRSSGLNSATPLWPIVGAALIYFSRKLKFSLGSHWKTSAQEKLAVMDIYFNGEHKFHCYISFCFKLFKWRWMYRRKLGESMKFKNKNTLQTLNNNKINIYLEQ